MLIFYQAETTLVKGSLQPGPIYYDYYTTVGTVNTSAPE